jgi:hypothetical protein
MSEDAKQDQPERGSNVFVELEPQGETVEIPASVFTEGSAAIEHWLAAERAKRAAIRKPPRRAAASED